MTALVSPFAGDPLLPGEAVTLSGVLKALADPSRLRILSLLNKYGELTTREVEEELGGLSQPTVTHHLAILTEAGLIVTRRVGAFAYRTLDRGSLALLAGLLTPGGAE